MSQCQVLPFSSSPALLRHFILRERLISQAWGGDYDTVIMCFQTEPLKCEDTNGSDSRFMFILIYAKSFKHMFGWKASCSSCSFLFKLSRKWWSFSLTSIFRKAFLNIWQRLHEESRRPLGLIRRFSALILRTVWWCVCCMKPHHL